MSQDPVAQQHPVVIQGGMGIAVSGWELARAVSIEGHLGVVSGTALDSVLVRRLEAGDAGGHVRRALAAFPVPGVADELLGKYFIEGGKAADQRFSQTSMKRHTPTQHVEDLLVVANFVEVWLAKEGHDHPVGINFLEKVQTPVLPSLYGAMLAGVDYVLMGAGIPKAVPPVLDKLAAGEAADYRLDVKGLGKPGGSGVIDGVSSHFDPVAYLRGAEATAERPRFLAIVSSHILATMLATKTEVPADGFIIEAPVAGGHNAPPRGRMQLDDNGEPIYGERDKPDLAVFRELGLPFWLAGGEGSPERLTAALEAGAAGIQVGTPFAFCAESGFTPEIKAEALRMSREGTAKVKTDPLASPSGFPFKVLEMEGTLSDEKIYVEHERQPCKLGYLRTAYAEDDKVVWRCPAEPVEVFIRKGGTAEEAEGRKCLCSALLANIGLAQLDLDGAVGLPLVTSGNEVEDLRRFLPGDGDTYTAADVLRYLTSALPASA